MLSIVSSGGASGAKQHNRNGWEAPGNSHPDAPPLETLCLIDLTNFYGRTMRPLLCLYSIRWVATDPKSTQPRTARQLGCSGFFMIHSFDTQHAKDYGLVEAAILGNFVFWIAKNQANNTHFYDGRHWTYNSVAAFEKLFGYLTPKQIRRALDSLVEQGVLLRGHYNQNKFDRSSWYGFSDAFQARLDAQNGVNAFAQKGESDLPEKADQICPKGQITNRYKTIENQIKSTEDDGFSKFWASYPKKDGKLQAKKAFDKQVRAGSRLADMLDGIDRQKNSREWVSGFIPNPATWLNGCRWLDEGVTLGGHAAGPSSPLGIGSGGI